MTAFRRGIGIMVLAVVVGGAGCPARRPDHAAAVRAIHDHILMAHRNRDAAAWTALEADTVIVGSRGRLFFSPRAERLAHRREYFAATRFSVYRDLRSPIVDVARDGSQAWLIANVEVVAHPDLAGAADSTRTEWTWIELYEQRAGRWQLVGNVSTARSGPAS
jgi:hypothetical protein